DTGAAQILEPAQHVVVPPRREGEVRPRGPERRIRPQLPVVLDRLTRRSPPEQTALQQELLAALPRSRQRRRESEALLVFEQRLEHADRRVEGRSRRSVLRLAVPAAIRQLLAEQAIEDALHILTEIRADRGDLTVDARLDLTVEEPMAVALRRAAALPRHIVADKVHRAACLIGGRIDAEIAQQHERMHGGIPAAVPCRAAPPAIRALEGEDVRTDALGGDAS